VRQIIFLTWLFLVLATTANALSSSAPVNLSADSLILNQETGLYRAEGDVLISQGDLVLQAGSADWNQETGEALCRDGIRLESPEGVLTGDSLKYDFNRGLGLLENGDARFSAYSVYLAGEQIEKRGDISYRVTDGTFTTCAGETPSWKLTSSQLDVDIEGYARARHAIFYLRNVPVLYLPYIALPAKTERQSGLLFPEISHSNRLGNRYQQPFYLVLDDHLDATFDLDYMSDFGVGTALEMRYLPPSSRPGRLYVNYINGLKEEPDRVLAEWDHDGLLPGGIRLVADAEYVNKKDYYNIFGQDADSYAREKVQSTLYLSRAWDRTNLSGQAKYIRNLEQSSADQLQYLPELRLDYLPQRIGDSPLFAAFMAEPTYLWHRDGLKGGRLRLLPLLGTDLFVSRYLELVPTVSWLQRNYHFDGSDEDKGVPLASLTAGSRLTRVYRLESEKVSHLRHVIEPMLHYLYIPNVDQSDLPQLDSRDRIDPVNLVTFELMNRLTARILDGDGTPKFREIASLRLAVDYDISEQRRDLGPPPDTNRPFSPVRGELVLRPSENSFLRGDIAYDGNDNAGYVESWSAWGGFNDRQGNGLLVNYNYQKDDFDYISGGIDLALFDPLYISYEHRQDLISNLKLEDVVQLEYRGQCWSLMLSYSDRPDEEKINIQFSLSGFSRQQLIDSVTASIKNFF